MKKTTIFKKKRLRYQESRIGLQPKILGPINLYSGTMRFCKKDNTSSIFFKNYRNRGISSKRDNKFLIRRKGFSFWVTRDFNRFL